MKPALSQVCSLESPFETDIEDYAAGQCFDIELWLTKLETYVSQHSVDAVKKLREQHGVTFPVASYQGGLLTSQGEARREAWKLFRQRLDLCQTLGVSVMVVACDILPPIVQQDIDRAQASLLEVASEAGKRGVKIALEFQSQAAFGNNLQTAAAIVSEAGSPHLGLCLDVFQMYIGPSKTEDLGYLNNSNLFHVHFSDLADTPREFAADSDRILPGDGDLPLQTIVQALRDMQYDGYVAMELMNPQIWRVPARQFGEIGITSLRKSLGVAEK